MHHLAGIQVEWVEEETQRGLLFENGLGYKLMVAISINNYSQHIWWIFVAWEAVHKDSKCSVMADKICGAQMIYSIFDIGEGHHGAINRRVNKLLLSKLCSMVTYFQWMSMLAGWWMSIAEKWKYTKTTNCVSRLRSHSNSFWGAKHVWKTSEMSVIQI